MAKSALKRVSSREEKTTIDHTTGEVTKEEHVRTLNISKEPPFVKLYIEDLSKILSIKQGPQNLLYYLACSADYENIIELTTRKRERMCTALGIAKQTFANYLFYLKEVDVIKDMGGQELMLNPLYFAKGNWADIEKHRMTYQMVVSYKSDGHREVRGRIVKPSKNDNSDGSTDPDEPGLPFG